MPVFHCSHENNLAWHAADILHRAINKIGDTSVLHVLALMYPVPQSCEAAPRYRYVVLEEAALLRYAENKASDMTVPFIKDACRRGDRCYAALDGETLASYQWCATQSTRVNDRFIVTVPTAWTYKYKALTMEGYRGQRLHAHLSSLVQRDAMRSGATGVFACVEINNRPSLTSFARMRATRVGTLAAIGVRGRYRLLTTTGCRSLGIQLVRPPA